MKFNFFVGVGIVWILFGCLGLFFALKKFNTHLDLNRQGQVTEGTVISEAEVFSIRDRQTGRVRTVSERDFHRYKKNLPSSPSNYPTVEYILKYYFYTSDQTRIEGESVRSFSSGLKANDSIAIVYLPEHPEVNDLKDNIEFDGGSMIFWAVGGLFWLAFFLWPGIKIMSLGKPRV